MEIESIVFKFWKWYLNHPIYINVKSSGLYQNLVLGIVPWAVGTSGYRIVACGMGRGHPSARAVTPRHSSSGSTHFVYRELFGKGRWMEKWWIEGMKSGDEKKGYSAAPLKVMDPPFMDVLLSWQPLLASGKPSLVPYLMFSFFVPASQMSPPGIWGDGKRMGFRGGNLVFDCCSNCLKISPTWDGIASELVPFPLGLAFLIYNQREETLCSIGGMRGDSHFPNGMKQTKGQPPPHHMLFHHHDSSDFNHSPPNVGSLSRQD